MADEYREITFEPRELQVALRDYGKRADRISVDDGGPLRVQVTGAPEVRAKLVLEGRSVNFNAEEIVAALIMFASRHNMPVPKRAQKYVTASRERVTLHLNTYTPWI